MCNDIDLICTAPERCGGQCWKFGRRIHHDGTTEETVQERTEKRRDTIKEECLAKFADRLSKRHILLLNWQNDNTLMVHIREDHPDFGCPQIIATSWLQEMPGCCAILVSRNNSVLPIRHRRGFGSLLQEIKIWLRDRMGYGSLMCTVAGHNEAENHLLEKFGWVPHTSTFTNPKTNNQIRVWINHKSK